MRKSRSKPHRSTAQRSCQDACVPHRVEARATLHTAALHVGLYRTAQGDYLLVLSTSRISCQRHHRAA
eukprot:1701327-Prymnesium_polylepis.1